MIFLDTCILIDYVNNKIDIDINGDYCISSIVLLEFKAGARDKKELKKINRVLSGINLIDTDQDILNLADLLMEKYVLSHRMSIYDAIIASTCLIYDLELSTLNKKDFRYIERIKLV